MANPDHIEMLHQGRNAWNLWKVKQRRTASRERPHAADLSGADLNGADLAFFDLGGANLRGADLRKASLQNAFLGGADLTSCDARQTIFFEARLGCTRLRNACLKQAMLQACDLCRADFAFSDLERADLSFSDARGSSFTDAVMRNAYLGHSVLSGADFRRADLRDAWLNSAILTGSNLDGADLSGACVYGIAAWDISTLGCNQMELRITTTHPPITVDNLRIAQFIHLLLHNEEIREAIEALTCKVVLVLGRFTPERKEVLDAVKAELRRLDLVPILFDFAPPATRDFTETVVLLAGIARFVVADLSSPRSIPLELQAVVPQLRLPVVPLLARGEEPFGMFSDLKSKYDWVMDVVEYDSISDLVSKMRTSVLGDALARHDAIAKAKASF